MKTKLIFIFINLLLTNICFAQTNIPQTDAEFIAFQKANKEKIIAPFKADVVQLADQAKRNVQAKEMQAFIHELQTKTKLGEAIDTATNPSHSKIMIFISDSMPRASLEQWFAQAQQFGVPIILRGLIDDSLLATKQWIKPLIEHANGKGGVQINPIAFQTYGVHQVPAVVITDEATECQSNQSCMPFVFDVVYGNVSFTTALKIIAEKGEVGNSAAKQLFAKMQQKKNEKNWHE